MIGKMWLSPRFAFKVAIIAHFALTFGNLVEVHAQSFVMEGLSDQTYFSSRFLRPNDATYHGIDFFTSRTVVRGTLFIFSGTYDFSYTHRLNNLCGLRFSMPLTVIRTNESYPAESLTDVSLGNVFLGLRRFLPTKKLGIGGAPGDPIPNNDEDV